MRKENRFARLFEVGGSQLVVLMVTTEEGLPALQYMTRIDGVDISTNIVVQPKEGELAETAWAKAEMLFETFDDEKAQRTVKGIADQYIDLAKAESLAV